jgi:hypothetical protein
MHAAADVDVTNQAGRLAARAGVEMRNVPLPGWWELLGRDTRVRGDIAVDYAGAQMGQVEAGGIAQAGPVLLQGRSKFRVQDVWQSVSLGMRKLIGRVSRQEPPAQ